MKALSSLHNPGIFQQKGYNNYRVKPGRLWQAYQNKAGKKFLQILKGNGGRNFLRV
jgi:hypothetical protein